MPDPSPDDLPRNAGQAFAVVVADELVRHGVTDAVLAPGSRSTPLALAFAANDRLRLHVRVDERSAAYLAVGLARATGRVVPLLCTSGTAAAHFHGAVLECDQSRVPLLVLTADRPPELRGVGANQTIDQAGLYGGAVRWSCDVGVPEARPDSVRYWRSLVSRAVAAATGAASPSGPVHLNLPLREPLVGTDDGVGFRYPLAGRPDGQPWTAAERGRNAAPPALADIVGGSSRGVVVVGDGLTAADVDGVLSFAEQAGWPVVAEPHSNARRGPMAVAGVDPLLRSERFRTDHAPDLVVVAGRAGLSRPLLGWLAGTTYVVVDRDGRWADVARSARAVFRMDPAALAALEAETEDGWAAGWLAAGNRAAAAVDDLLDRSEVTEPGAVRDVVAALPDGAALVVASSMPIRDLDLVLRPRSGLRIVANRGVSGIDGFVSTAVGVALGHAGPTVAVAGDLSLLHDVNGLLVENDRPDLTVVVLNNDGGGIFSMLPQAEQVPAATFDRLFGTPHGLDLGAVVTAYGARHVLAKSSADLHAAVAERPSGLQVVEVRTDRAANAALHERLRTAAAAALS